ncbi:1-aminocyclopropane-1-carboxylate deaminase, partial [Aliarcobacter lanthieri]
MNYTNSPIEEISFNNQKYFIKRDDLLHVDFSGNKARKLYYFLKNNLKGINKVISYGSAQS